MSNMYTGRPKPKGISQEEYKAAQHEKKLIDMEYDLNQKANKMDEKLEEKAALLLYTITELRKHFFEFMHKSNSEHYIQADQIELLRKENSRLHVACQKMQEKMDKLEKKFDEYLTISASTYSVNCLVSHMNAIAKSIEVHDTSISNMPNLIISKCRQDIKQAVDDLMSIPSELPAVEKFIHEQLGIISQDSIASRKRLSECEGWIKLLSLQLEHTKLELRKLKGE